MSRRGWCQDSRWSCYQRATTAGEPWPGLCVHTQDSTPAAHVQGRPQAGFRTADGCRHTCDACMHYSAGSEGMPAHMMAPMAAAKTDVPNTRSQGKGHSDHYPANDATWLCADRDLLTADSSCVTVLRSAGTVQRAAGTIWRLRTVRQRASCGGALGLPRDHS